MANDPRSWLDRLAAAAMTLLLAAIAISVAITIIEPYLGFIGVVVGIGVALTVYRAWQRSRW
ncbi:hypothetical protein [Marmoricola sp. URHB0036]|uniref:hypothetical protein n=1 Tax=Marmoricola sp. URHB0036 TaxID=1298863 RepID=UPI000408F8CE|nr:hypothetical protein [Marmoricola sp. URHB0036]